VLRCSQKPLKSGFLHFGVGKSVIFQQQKAVWRDLVRVANLHHFARPHAAVEADADQRPGVPVLALPGDLEHFPARDVVLALIADRWHGNVDVAIAQAVMLVCIPAGGPEVRHEACTRRAPKVLRRSQLMQL
jgi:hypothetical protein